MYDFRDEHAILACFAARRGYLLMIVIAKGPSLIVIVRAKGGTNLKGTKTQNFGDDSPSIKESLFHCESTCHLSSACLNWFSHPRLGFE